MNPTSLPERIARYLDRQHLWAQQISAFLATLETRLAEEDLDAIVEIQRQQHNQFLQLQLEYRALYKEWEAATNIPADERQAVQQRSQALRQELNALQQQYALSIQTIEKSKARNRRHLTALRQGQALLKKYRPGLRKDADFLDKHA